jgi:hypothetical protein
MSPSLVWSTSRRRSSRSSVRARPPPRHPTARAGTISSYNPRPNLTDAAQPMRVVSAGPTTQLSGRSESLCHSESNRPLRLSDGHVPRSSDLLVGRWSQRASGWHVDGIDAMGGRREGIPLHHAGLPDGPPTDVLSRTRSLPLVRVPAARGGGGYAGPGRGLELAASTGRPEALEPLR